MGEIREFQAETQKLLDLMIHSLYSHKEIFLRELISNASDALDRVRFAGLTDPSLLPGSELAITLVADPDARTLAVEDNGIGMTRDEVISQIGTIAHSGTAEVLAQLGDRKDRPGSLDLIGQFGVGFYSSFMVADQVTLSTRKAGSASPDAAVSWASSANGRYTLDDGTRAGIGTTVTLHLLPVDAEAGISDFSDEWVLRDVVKRYSDFVAYPIRLRVVGRSDAPGEPLNSMKAIWTRPPDTIDEDEHAEFYRHISRDPRPPLLRIPVRIEGTFEARALLYVPSAAPFDLYHRERGHSGVQLYVKRVFIMDECRDLIPEYLRFVKGVVDAEDLPLNVSREILQHDAQIRAIRRHLTKKVLEALGELSKNDDEKYLRFWSEFGAVLKEGLLAFEDAREKEDRKDQILALMRCASTAHEERLTSLADYVSRMPTHQDAIYYLSGPSHKVLATSPQLEAFRSRGIEVLLFSDPVDEVWLQQRPPEYEGRTFQSAAEGTLELGSAEEKKEAALQAEAQQSAFKPLLASLRAAIQDEVKEVRLSPRLTESAACLVRDEGDLSPQIEAMLRQAGQQVPRARPILELNPSHPLIVKLKAIHERDAADLRVARYASLLLDQAVLVGGGQLDDPAGFGRRLSELMDAALSERAAPPEA